MCARVSLARPHDLSAWLNHVTAYCCVFFSEFNIDKWRGAVESSVKSADVGGKCTFRNRGRLDAH